MELHLHLEGAAPPRFVRGLAAEKHVDISGAFAEDGGYATGDFSKFLKVYEAVAQVIDTPDDYGRLMRAVLEESARHGVVYTEVFTAPQLQAGSDLSLWRDHLHAMREGAAAVPEVEVRLIATCVRHMGPEAARGAAICAAEAAGDLLTGWGMGGDERVGRATDFAWSFDCAREAGLGITVHAGEFGGPDSVRDALRLGPLRIGHGVRAAEDDALVDRLAEDGIVLEVCPGSNVALGLYPSLRAHPVERLRARGVPVTISTDDPPFFRTDMSREYEALAEAHGWDDGVFAEVNRTAARAAFCGSTTRDKLLKGLD